MRKSEREREMAQSKQGKYIITQSGEGYCIEQTNIMEMCSQKWLHPNKPQEGWMQPNKQVALKTNKHKPTEGTKNDESLNLVKQTWI